ncbi:ComF family protein [Roseiarcaceae bacterium H3SJ34-1]|uniref:ComF family protein n=1 Tax=Terripilifer ovatus TaxID=3032367 RepID=UPI003AB9911D|nr:ComF family protein [Roseiarcaceae bacterium H3SJ34-1]
MASLAAAGYASRMWTPEITPTDPENSLPARLPEVGDKPRDGFALLHAILQNAAQQVLDIVYPPSCVACLAAVQQSAALCTTCWSTMPFIERPFCERLGTPFTHDLGPGLVSPEAIANPPVYGRARAVARFEDGPARQLVHRLKYGDRAELAAPMGRWMTRAAAELLPDADLLVPVPLHRRRLFQRRFNQAAVLAQTISRLSGVPSDPLVLRRVRPTSPQVGLTRAQRADNVQGAFRVSPEDRPKIDGRKVVLVDDVMTSGATANAASRVLLRAGAASVDVVVFARVV